MTMISQKAMLAHLKVSQWSARKLDRKITDEVNRDHNAAHDAGRYNKSLLAKEALADITKAASAARSEHYRLTLPWLDDGARILSAVGYERYAREMRQIREGFDNAVTAFLDNYSHYVAEAEARLNGMFNPTDYPSQFELSRKFHMETIVFPVPSQEDFRVDISEAAAEQIRQDIEARANDAQEGAIKDCWKRIHDVTSKMAERLEAYEPGEGKAPAKGVFRDSLVENVRDLVDILPSLNVTNDQEMDQIARDMHASLCKTDAATLRDSDGHRQVVGQAAKAIADQVGAYLA